MSSSDLKSSFPTSHDTAGYVGFANLPNQVSPIQNMAFELFIFFLLKGSPEIGQEGIRIHSDGGWRIWPG